jgi:signal transduction histidine kinase
MKLTLRRRIVLTLLPLLALLALLGIAAIFLLSRLGGRVSVILRENYDSVRYMERLNEALERIDSAFQFALAGREHQARRQYDDCWKDYRTWLKKEEGNITVPGEGEQVERLRAATEAYRRQGDLFFAQPAVQAVTAWSMLAVPLPQAPAAGPVPDLLHSLSAVAAAETINRTEIYFGDEHSGTKGLLKLFQEIKDHAGKILLLNQKNMEDLNREAQATADSSLVWFGAGTVLAALLALGWAWRTVRTILHPIRAVTESALAIGTGNLNQVLEVTSEDEVGRLAVAFNTMARQLRDFRQSQQARIHRLQQTTQAAIDALPHPVLVIEPGGRVEQANPAARKLLGVAASGDTLAAIWQPPEALRAPLTAALREQQPYLPEGFDKTISLGGERFFLPRILPIRAADGATLGAAVLLEDVTRFRLLDEVKSNLVATVSHELKTPLSSIRLVVHLLLEETVGPLTPKQLDLLLDARDNTERLLVMINNLLDLARVQEGKRQLAVQSVLPSDLLGTAAEEFRSRAQDKGIALTVEASPDLSAVAADPLQVGHALHNLLDNALTYTPRGGRITLTATGNDHTVTLSVQDTGLGIPREHLPHIFERFFRVPGRSGTGGTGLGLAIVREIAQAHGGKASVESQIGEGTVFSITLPAWGVSKG